MDQLNLFQDGPGIPMLEEGEGIEALNSLQTKTAAEAEQVERVAAPQPTQEQEEPQQPAQPEGAIAGTDGTVRDPGWSCEGGVARLVDTFDNLFQGDQKTYEEVKAGLAEARERTEKQNKELQEKFEKADPVGATVTDITERAVPGAVLGATESALGAAEIVGDTVKTFATLGTVAPDQHVFRDEYDWAKWNLGKDEYGAQTGVGKVAQGFIEFGAVSAATGGFGGVAGAGAKVAGATTKLGKAAAIAKVGAVEGLYGVAADMVMASKGEGNMANLIAENIPGLKDTFVTLLLTRTTTPGRQPSRLLSMVSVWVQSLALLVPTSLEPVPLSVRWPLELLRMKLPRLPSRHPKRG